MAIVNADAGQRAFERLIAPVGTEEFFRERWERTFLHRRRGEAGYYASWLSGADLERIIATEDLRYPAIQLARRGGYFPPEVYTRSVPHGSEVFAGVPDREKIRSEYRAGTTIVLPALHRTWAPLGELCASLEAYFSHAVHANAYLTPGNAAGFGPHYDTHEVFVLQIAGEKRWRVHAPPIPLPHRSQPFGRQGYVPPPPVLECELRAGDLLYLPRGYVHSAATSEGHSAHVTIGITVYTWVELLSELLASAKESSDSRAALPVGFARDAASRDAMSEGLARRLSAIEATTDLLRVVDTFTRRVRASRQRDPRTFAIDVTVIGPETCLTPPERTRYTVASSDGAVVLRFDGKELLLPEGVRATLEGIGEFTSFRLADLPKHLEDHATLAFLQYLHGEGFLRLAAGPRDALGSLGPAAAGDSAT